MAKKTLSATAGQDMADYIREHLGETLSYRTIDELCGTNSSNQQYNLIVGPLIKDGVIVPTESQILRGNEQAPLYKTYRICKRLPTTLKHSGSFMQGDANMGTIDESVADLNPLLTKNGFLAQNLDAVEAWKPELLLFGEWLDTHEGPLPLAIPEERSFEVFHNEKLLLSKGERRGGRALTELINNTGLMPRLYLQSEVRQELVYYVPRTLRRTLTVLIVENHAPFVHIQEEMARGSRLFFGRHVDGVIYGKGTNIAAENTLATTESLFADGRMVRYLYWGDIDRPGIIVFEQLTEMADVEPLMKAYELMIDYAGNDLPVSPEPRMPDHMGVEIASRLQPGHLEVFMRVLACGLRIPQEAIPSSAYEGGAGSRRLTETLRSRRRA